MKTAGNVVLPTTSRPLLAPSVLGSPMLAPTCWIAIQLAALGNDAAWLTVPSSRSVPESGAEQAETTSINSATYTLWSWPHVDGSVRALYRFRVASRRRALRSRRGALHCFPFTEPSLSLRQHGRESRRAA